MEAHSGVPVFLEAVPKLQLWNSLIYLYIYLLSFIMGVSQTRLAGPSLNP
jgi:hypothetical protein